MQTMHDRPDHINTFQHTSLLVAVSFQPPVKHTPTTTGRSSVLNRRGVIVDAALVHLPPPRLRCRPRLTTHSKTVKTTKRTTTKAGKTKNVTEN